MDENLPGLTRELAVACWRAVDMYLPERPGNGLYRALYRAVRATLRQHLRAFRYCGAAASCDYVARSARFSKVLTHERFPGEHMHIYILEPGIQPSALVDDVLRETLRAVVDRLPKQRLKGMARFLRRQIEKVFHGRMVRSDLCGEAALCPANEPYDPWDMFDATKDLADNPT